MMLLEVNFCSMCLFWIFPGTKSLWFVSLWVTRCLWVYPKSNFSLVTNHEMSNFSSIPRSFWTLWKSGVFTISLIGLALAQSSSLLIASALRWDCSFVFANLALLFLQFPNHFFHLSFIIRFASVAPQGNILIVLTALMTGQQKCLVGCPSTNSGKIRTCGLSIIPITRRGMWSRLLREDWVGGLRMSSALPQPHLTKSWRYGKILMAELNQLSFEWNSSIEMRAWAMFWEGLLFDE